MIIIITIIIIIIVTIIIILTIMIIMIIIGIEPRSQRWEVVDLITAPSSRLLFSQTILNGPWFSSKRSKSLLLRDRYMYSHVTVI